MTTIDRSRLAEPDGRERERFSRTHPRSAELSEDAQRSLLYGVPMNWMTRWPGEHPVWVAEAARRPLHRRGRHRLRRPVSGRHRRDGGPRPEGRRRRDRRAGGEGPHADAPHRGRDLGRRRDAPAVRPPVLAVLPHRDRREPVRAAARTAGHRPVQGRRPRLELPRQRRRDLRHARGRPGGARSTATSVPPWTRRSRRGSCSSTTSRRSRRPSPTGTSPAACSSRPSRTSASCCPTRATTGACATSARSTARCS